MSRFAALHHVRQVSAVFNYTDTTFKNIDSAVIDEFRINTLERGLPNTPSCARPPGSQ